MLMQGVSLSTVKMHPPFYNPQKVWGKIKKYRANSDCIKDGFYIDDGISGTNTKKREDFNRMIDDCEAGNIDMIITKSISRFARNTLDCLKYIRELKDINIPVIFEKESIAHTTQKS